MLTPSAFLTPGISTFSQDLLVKGQGITPKVPAQAPERVQCLCQQLWAWLWPGEWLLQGGLVSTAGWCPFWLPSGSWRTASVCSVGTHHRQASSQLPLFPCSKRRSVTLANKWTVVPLSGTQPFRCSSTISPFGRSSISNPTQRVLPPLALTFNHLYGEVGLYLPHSAGEFPEVKGFWFSYSSITKPCSCYTGFKVRRCELLNLKNGTSLLGDIK